jgi:calmodulin
LTCEQVEELKEAFRMFDKDSDGIISSEEFGSAMSALGLTPTKEELEILLASVDTDANGVVDFGEFVDVMSHHLWLSGEGPSAEDELKEAFSVFDKDGNGFISKEELKSALLNLGEQLDDDELEAMIKAADKDGNGEIDYEEFIQMMKN